jgi:hypothetical protein
MFDNLPVDIHWNILKFLRHPVAEIFISQPFYNQYLSTKEDTYTNIGGETLQINELIPFYDIWRIYRFNAKYRYIYRIRRKENLE